MEYELLFLALHFGQQQATQGELYFHRRISGGWLGHHLHHAAAAVLVSAIGNGTKYCCRDILHPNIVHRMPVNHRKSVSRVLRCYGKIAA